VVRGSRFGYRRSVRLALESAYGAQNRPGRPRPGTALRTARARLASVLVLQRTAGNAMTGRLLARSPRKPYEHQWENPALLETIYPAREIMLKKFVSIYRELELRDLTDPKARQQVIDDTRKAMQGEVDKLKAELEQLQAPNAKPEKNLVQTKQARVKVLEATLKRGQGSVAQAFEDAVQWERAHRTDPLAGATLLAEVKRLFGTKAVPDWIEQVVLDYAGMRYKSAHSSYFNPVRLVFLIERARGTWTKAREAETAAADEAYKKARQEWEAKDPDPRKRGKAPSKPKPVTEAAAERATLKLSPAEAVAQLEKMHDAGQIPEWAWHKIVRLTELRTWYAEAGWEDVSKEKPPAGADAVWLKVMQEWSGDRQERLGEHGYGGTAWRAEVRRRNVLLTTRMVCDQLSEVTQQQRGVQSTVSEALPSRRELLGGGISANAQAYVAAAEAGAEPGAKKGIVGAYIREPRTLADLRPGAALFWVEEAKWDVEKPDDSNMVRHMADARYPMPVPPEYVKEWTDWSKTPEGKKWLSDTEAYKKAKPKYDYAKKGWDLQAAKVKALEDKAKTDAEKAKAAQARAKLPAAPVEPTAPKDLQPEYKEGALLPKVGGVPVLPARTEVINDWTYTVAVGQPITRSKGGVTHWLTWKHQATVLNVMPDGRIITFETTVERVGETKFHGSGVGTRYLAELARPGVFVAYMPAEVDAPLVTAPDELDLGDILIDLFIPSLVD
jgi:hypothetical protein